MTNSQDGKPQTPGAGKSRAAAAPLFHPHGTELPGLDQALRAIPKNLADAFEQREVWVMLLWMPTPRWATAWKLVFGAFPIPIG